VFYTALIAAVDPGSKLQLALAVVTAAVYLVAYIKYRPFVVPDDDVVAEVAAWSVFMTLFVCFMIRTGTSFHRSNLQPLVSTILVAAACLPLLGFAVVLYPTAMEQFAPAAKAVGAEKKPEQQAKQESCVAAQNDGARESNSEESTADLD
jgi:hypothetical protein